MRWGELYHARKVHTHARTHAHPQARTHARTHTRTRTRTRTRTHIPPTHTFFVNNFLINNDYRLKLLKVVWCYDLNNIYQGKGTDSLNRNNYFHFYPYTIYFNIFSIKFFSVKIHVKAFIWHYLEYFCQNS